MYGKGQNPKSLFSQLEKAMEEKQEVFNMSGGEQIRDFLPVEKMAEYIVDIALQNNTTGIINCCSGEPVKLKDLVTRFLKEQECKHSIKPWILSIHNIRTHEFLGRHKKTNNNHKGMSNPILAFIEERKERIEKNGGNEELKKAADDFNVASNKAQYSYNFSWMGRPIIQYPQDMIAMQEIIWELKPDLIIETGIAHGGSLILLCILTRTDRERRGTGYRHRYPSAQPCRN
ncbi:MAG: CmcI family methyltransferase [Ferruginibacter sp.]